MQNVRIGGQPVRVCCVKACKMPIRIVYLIVRFTAENEGYSSGGYTLPAAIDNICSRYV